MESLRKGQRRRVCGERRGVRLGLSLHWGPAWRVRAELPPLAGVVDIFSRAHVPSSRAPITFEDPEFERAYAVDGAPLPLVRGLVDGPIRKRIAALGAERIRIGEGALEILKRDHFHFDERREIAEAFDLAVDLVHRVEALAREQDSALVGSAPHAGSPYRGGPDARAVEALAQARDEDVRAAQKRSRCRYNKSRLAAGIAFGAWLVFEAVAHIV